jgi:surface protein
MTYAASGTTNGIFKNNTSTPWNSYKSAMTEVVVLSSFKPSSLGYWFNGFTKINSISGLDLVDYTYCKSFIGLFYGNTTLTSLDLSGVNTSNVVNMYQMFRGCTALTEIDLNSFNTANVLNYGEMFYGDTALVSIYVSGRFIINNNITNDTNMFYNCTRVVGGAGTTYSSSAVTSARAHIDGGTSNPGYFTRKSGLRITGRLDGIDNNDLGIYATCDVTINNILVADDVTSYFERLEPGTTYNIVCTPANGITEAGVVSGSMSGTIGDDLVNTRISYSTTGYTRLEYIESIAGAKYKDTNNALFSGWSGARFEYDIMSTGGGYLLYRQRTSYNDYLRINGTTVSFSYDDAGASISNGITTNQRQIVTFQIYGSGSNYTYKLTANGKSVTSADGPLSFQYRIFFGNTSTNSFIGRIYGFKYYLNTNDLVYSFVPMQRISDGKVGLYDVITGTFISSNGTAEFTAGPVSTN